MGYLDIRSWRIVNFGKFGISAEGPWIHLASNRITISSRPNWISGILKESRSPVLQDWAGLLSSD